jgi:hypothetical protein
LPLVQPEQEIRVNRLQKKKERKQQTNTYSNPVGVVDHIVIASLSNNDDGSITESPPLLIPFVARGSSVFNPDTPIRVLSTEESVEEPSIRDELTFSDNGPPDIVSSDRNDAGLSSTALCVTGSVEAMVLDKFDVPAGLDGKELCHKDC